MARASKSFGTQHAKIPHLIEGRDGVPGEIYDVRKDVEEAFETNESRTGFPELDWLDGAMFAAAGGTAVLRGRNLIQSQTFDTYSYGAANAAISFTAMKPGVSCLKVVVVAGSGGLTAAVSGSTLTVTLASGGSSASAVATAVNVAATAKGIIRAHLPSGTGASNIAALALTSLAGGTGYYAGNTVTVGGVVALPLHATGNTPAATWADTVISVTVPDLTGVSPALATGDTVAVVIHSNGIATQPFTVVLGGILGAQGAVGNQGNTGATGVQGNQGPQGVT